MIGKVLTFKNGIYIHDGFDLHAGTFIIGDFYKLLTMGNNVDFDFDFQPTLNTDYLQECLGQDFLYNYNRDSWEHLRNCLHRSMKGNGTEKQAYFDYNMIGYDNYEILRSKDITRYSNKGRGCDNNFNKSVYVNEDKHNLNVIFCNLLMPRYLKVIKGNVYYMVDYLPYLTDCNRNHDRFLEDLKNENN